MVLVHLQQSTSSYSLLSEKNETVSVKAHDRGIALACRIYFVPFTEEQAQSCGRNFHAE